MKLFNNPSAKLVKRSLDVLMKHHRNVSENVANMNVAGYERKPTRFLDELRFVQDQGRLRTTRERHMKPDGSEVDPPEWEKGAVRMTREMTDLALNQIRYDFSSKIMRRKFDGLRESITGRPK